MKFTKNDGCLLMMVILALAAFLPGVSRAQSIDTFAVPRSIVLTPPRILDASAAVFTNGPIDIGDVAGVANIDITSVTNAGGALTASIYTSTDQTNLTALANYALISATTDYIYTNRVYGSALFATNKWLLPGTLKTPVGATAGFTTPYLDNTTTPFTNSAAVTITAKGVYRIGFRAQDVGRYVYIVYTPTGSSSNDIVSATLTGIPRGEVGTSQ